MEIYGNISTFNMETVLRQNIINSDYFRGKCMKLSSWSEVVDEIYEHVEHVEPWMSGNARGPSTAFCLLCRFFTLKLTVAEIRETIDHPDSPYIRAVGFLYLRYVCDPKNLRSWLERYYTDSEEFQPSPNGKTITMGEYVRDLLLELYYFETIFPRIPKKIQDEIVDNLRSRGLPTTGKGNGGAGGPDRRGLDEPNKRPASVKASLSVAFGQRAPNRAGAREEGRGRDPSLAERDREERQREKGAKGDGYRHRSSPGRETSPVRNGRNYSKDGSRGHGRSDRGGRSDRRRSRSLSRGRDRSRSPPRGYRRSSPRRSSYSPARGGAGTSEKDYDGYGGGRDARCVFKESASDRYRGSADMSQLRSRYGDAQGALFNEDRRRELRSEEVYRLGGGRYR